LLVSIIIFLIALIYVGLSIYFNWNYTEKEPPTVNACPDYWKIDENGNCIIPKTGNNTGTLSQVLVPNMNYKKPQGYNEVNLNNNPGVYKLSNTLIYRCSGIPKLENGNLYSNSELTYTGLGANRLKVSNDMNQCYYVGNIKNYDENKMICKYTLKYDIPDNTMFSYYTLDTQSILNPNERVWSKFGSPICAQRTWARSNNIEWEGVSNYNKC
jgi:hypothetical protein